MPPKRQAQICLDFRSVFRASVICLLTAVSIRAANITNTGSLSAGWGTATNSWNYTAVATPWDSVNGATNTAVLTYTGGNFVITNSGVWANGITLNPTFVTGLSISGGNITFSGSNPAINVTQSNSRLTFSNSFAVSGNQTITVAGSGTVSIAGSNTFSGNISYTGGVLAVTNTGWMGNATVTVGSSSNRTFSGGGRFGSIRALTSPGNTTPNAVLSNCTVLGQLLLTGTTNGSPVVQTTFNFGANYPAGYATANTGTVATNVVVNGRLDIIGSGSMSLSGVTGSSNGITTNAAVPGFNGSGILVSSNFWTNGGAGNTITMADGRNDFAEFYVAQNSVLTLAQSGSATTSFALFGYPQTNATVTLSGGTWLLGRIGQNNSSCMNLLTNTIAGNAAVTVSNAGYDGGVWNITQGSLAMVGNVQQKNSPQQGIQFNVGGSGTFTTTGNLRLGNSWYSSAAGYTNRLLVNGGSAVIGGNLLLGYPVNASNPTITFDTSLVSVTNGGILSVRGNLTVGDQGTGNSSCLQRVLLSGGELLVAQSLNAASIATTSTNGLLWTGGILSAYTINTTNVGWSDSSSSIQNGLLSNSAGTLAPGDTGIAGLTTIQGNYVQGGSGTLAIDLGGTIPASLFQHTNAGFSDQVAVTGSATLGGSLSVSLCQGYSPLASDVLTILTASSGITGSFTNVAFDRSVSVDGTNGFLVTMSGNSVRLSSFHRIGPPVITTQPVTQTAGLGGQVTLSVGANSPIPATYQWRFNSNPISGATNPTLTLLNLQSNNVGSYDVILSNADGITNSSVAVLSVLKIASVALQPSTMMIPTGGTATFSVSATAQLPISYQWRFNGSVIASATNSSYAVSSAQAANAGAYDVVMTTADGSVTSDQVNLVLLSTPLVTLTNTNSSWLWGGGSTNWSTSPVTNPFSPANGAFTTVILTNSSGSLRVDPSGVTVNGLNFSGVLAGSPMRGMAGGALTIAGGPVAFAGTNASILVGDPSAPGTSLTIVGGGLSGSGSITKTGNGALILNGPGTFAGNMILSAGSLQMGPLASYGSMSVTLMKGVTFNATGILGGLYVGGNGYGTAYNTGSGSAGSINATASDATFLGSVIIVGPDATKMAYATANMPTGSVGTNYGYARFGNGVVTTNLLVNGRLDLIGNDSMTLSGINGTSNGQTNWIGGGSGAIVNSSIYSVTNALGGTGNILSFTPGAVFSGFYFATNAYATLTQSGNGTVSFGIFGQPAGNTQVFSNSQTTFSGGTWRLGQLGQGNSWQIAGGTFVVTNGAILNVGGNTGASGPSCTHGNYLISQGQMNFSSTVAEGGGGNGALINALQFTVESAGTLTVNGTLQLGVNGVAGTVLSPSLLTLNGGLASATSLILGNANGTTAVINDIITTTVNGGLLSVGSGGIMVGYSSSSSVVSNEIASLILNGGEILCSGSLNAPTSLHSNSTITSSFVWNGGQLSVSQITASNTNWDGSDSSILNGQLSNTNGVLAPGDTGNGGLTAISGSYAQSAGGVLEIDLGGSTQASAFQSGINTYDTVSMTGTARLGGQLRVRVASGFVPSGSQTLTILSASGGVTGSFANLFATNRIISSDGKSSFRLSTNGTNLVLSGYSMVVPPVIVSAPVELAVVSGGSGTLSVTATSSVLPLTYQWRRNGAEIAGETNSSLVLSGIQSSDAAVYDVVVSNPQSFTNSAPVNVGLIPPPRFSSLPITTNVVAGLPVTLSSSVLSSLPMTYQWTRNGTDIAGATNALLTLANPAPGDSGIYVLRASNANGTVLSPSTTLTVLPLTAGGLSGNSLFAGGSATLSVEVSSSTSVSYQWRKNGISLPGATNAMLVISNALIGDTGSYSVTLSNSLGSTTTASAAVLVARPYVDPTVAFYPMDAFPVSGTGMVPDETGNTVGTLTGSSTNPLLLTNQPLPGGNAWSFTNTEAYVSIPNRSSGPLNALGNVISTPGMSVAFWVKYDYPGPKDGDNRAIIDIGSQATFYAATGHTAGLHKGIINLSFGNNNNIAQIVMPTPARSTSDNALNDTWHHVVATLDYNLPSNNAILYVDGSLAIDQYNQPVVMSQPINASFNSSANSAIGARVNGSYRFKANLAMVGFYTRALGAGEVAQLYNGTSIADFAPTLSVLADASLIEWPLNRVGLQGIASDDGLPGGGISYKWSQVTGPGLASFDSKTNPVTSATFSQPGAYTLRLTANDGYLSDFHDITVNVSTNTAPVVYVGTTNSTVKGGETVNLSGGAIDDGLPMSGGGVLTYSWTQVSGPAPAVISSPASNNTSVTMPSTPGNYLFRLSASDGYQTGSNSVAITVTARRAPVVTASALTPVIDILSTNSIALTGSAVLDGGGTSSFTWSQVSGATASFASPGSSNTTLTLPSAGVYQLRLTVSDGTSSSSSDVWVSAWSGSRGMLPPGILSTNAQPTNRVLDLGSAVPPPYVHPRIFFSEADRSSLRSATNDPLNPAVTNAIALLRSAVSKSIDNPSSPVGIAYQRLKTGDATWDIRGIVSAQNGPYETLIGNEKCGLYGPLASACYLAWLDQDNPAFQQRLKDLATAVATAARQHTTWYVSDRMEKANTTTNPNAYDPNSYDVYSDLAFCYDLMYNWMTEDQRGTTRSLLTWMTAGRLTLKAGGEPDYAHSTNHRIFHDHLIIAQLAIEGETGWDPSAIASNFLSKKIYYSVWGLTPDGFSREAPGYWVFGMHNGAPAAYALSKRYENLFATTHLYASMQELFYQMSPDETGKMYGTHDGCGWGNGGGSSTYYPIMKAVYPTDPYIDYVARKCWQNGGYNGMPLVVAIFGRPFLTPHTTFRDVAASKSMPQTIFSPQRGMGVARSDWSTNALQLDLDTRGDCMSLTHLHSSRNSFTLYALGREWFMGQGYHLTENDSKQTILIDNLGAASTSVTTATNSWFGSNAPSKWPSMPGRIVEVVDQPRIALFAGDAAPVYTYSWANIDFCEPSKSTSNLANSIVTPYRWRDMFYPGMTYPTPVVGDNSWLDNFILADSTLYNPVSKAFRTIMLVRGSDPVTATYPRSYSLILDDIQKTDTNTHTFVWSGNTLPCYPYNANPDTSLLSVSSNSAVMYHSNEPAAERPQLYVGIAAANGSGTITMDDTPLDNGEGPMPANRLLISRSNTVAPDFKILLYPHLNGESLPTTSYTQIVTNGTTNGTLTVNLPNGSGGFVSDVFNLRVQQDGRTRVTGYARGGVVPPTIAVPANITARTAGSNAPVGFTVTARDASGNTLTPSINPAPGSLFPTGTTVVNVSASDASGNMSSASFNVTVTPVDPPSPWTLTQVGLVTTGTAGSATYDTNSATFSLIGRGGVMSSAEAFTLLSQPWTNNGVFTARVRDLATKDLDGMAFLTARVSTNAGVVGAHVSVNGRGAVGFSTRSTANVSFSTTSSNGLSTPCWLRLVRSGTNVLGFTSPDGILWTQLGSSFSLGIATNTPFQIGLGASPDTAGYSAYATFDNVSLVGVPASVTGFAASNASSNVTLSWNPVTGAQGYLVGRSGASNGTFTNLAASSSAVNFRDVPPLPGVSYFYRVSATNVAGSSSPAGPVMGGLVAGVPTGLQAIPGSGRISLAWSSAASASAYTVKRSSSAGGPYSALASGLTNTAYTDTGVTAGNTYFYVVSATNGLGEGAPSLEVSETALNAIQAWRLAKFGTSDNSGLASDTANPSGDGIPNLMKYALGLDPLSTNAAARPLAILTNGYLQMTFSRTNDPVLVYSVEGTADFTAWTNIWSSTGASNVPGPVTVRDSNAPSSSTTRRFLRLRVTAP